MARKVNHVMPSVVPECCNWVDSSVLGAKSIVDDEFVVQFRKHHEFCASEVEKGRYEVVAPSSEDRACYVDPEGVNCIFVYEPIFTRIGVRVPFTEFEMEVLRECEVAPSQIHPNSWGFLRAYEVVCRELGFPTSLGVFHHLFKLTKPFSKDKQQWLSFRANQGRKVFEMNEESVRDFKNMFFKVIPQPGVTPFWIDGEGEYRFPLTWNEEWVNPKVERKELSESELLFVDVLNECWGVKDKHLPTRLLLTQSSKYVRDEILGTMSGKSSAYDRFKAHLLSKAKKPATLAGSGSGVSKPTSPEVVPPSSSSVPDSSSRKDMDGDNFIKNLEVVVRSSIKSAAISQAALNKLKGSVMVPDEEYVQLMTRVKGVEAEKRVIEGEKFELSSKVTTLEARLALGTQEVGSLKELTKRLEKEKSEAEEKYKKLLVESQLKAENLKQLEVELRSAQELCDKFSNDGMLLAEEIVENLKEQIQVLVPDFKVDQISPDFKVVDGVIVRPELDVDMQPSPEEVGKEVAEQVQEQVPDQERSPEVQPAMSDPPPTPTFDV
ncbi:hypothetical protein PIB30_095408 [Stylosanthes scabra]|uniref:Transposase (putative) gypsy type domain-containing protein n=1 Tax=Stylosanthes scabra TaxID=79078 RepID=A0ABU6UUM3_9FABA|nr:hypothetical protein [Stylosanthes scabra]